MFGIENNEKRKKESSLILRKAKFQAIFKFVLSSASGGAGGGKYNQIPAFVSMSVLLIGRSLEKFFPKNFRDDSFCFGFAKVTALALLLAFSTIARSRATTPSGTCGQNCYWSIENGTLIVTGGSNNELGIMDDFSWDGSNYDTPWKNYRSLYTEVDIQGVSNVGKGAFSSINRIPNLTKVKIGEGVTNIGEGAFGSNK